MKYRVYNKTKQVYENDNVVLTPGGKLFKIVPERILIELTEETHIVEWETGINDKNGTEIYTGDVVKCPWEEWYKYDIRIDRLFGKTNTYEDYYEDVVYDHEQLDMRENDYPDQWEVVGTIHDDKWKDKVF